MRRKEGGVKCRKERRREEEQKVKGKRRERKGDESSELVRVSKHEKLKKSGLKGTGQV